MADGDALIIGSNDIKGDTIHSTFADRLKGDTLHIPLFQSWQPLKISTHDDAMSFIGDEAEGDYTYLMPVQDSTGQVAIARVSDTDFSLLTIFVGTWYTPQDITYSNGNYYHRRYTFRSDNTFTFEGQTTKSTSKPSSWEVEVNSTYSILNYEVKGECVKVYIKIPGNDGVWYKGLIERWPHFIFFAYENTDGSLTHGVYMEPE